MNWMDRIQADAEAAGQARRNENPTRGRRLMACEKCGERLELVSPSAEAWHGSCKARGPKANLPRYVEAT